MVGSEDFFKDKNDDFATGGSSPRRSSGDSSDRNKMVEKVYKQVLGRKPTSREISYYKYSISDEDEIRNKLLDSDEHKNILRDYKELPGTKENLKDCQLDIKKSNQKLQDIGGEIVQLQSLITSQNKELTNLRDQLKNPYDLPSKLDRYEEGFDVYHEVRSTGEKESPRNWREKLLNVLELILK